MRPELEAAAWLGAAGSISEAVKDLVEAREDLDIVLPDALINADALGQAAQECRAFADILDEFAAAAKTEGTQGE